MKYRFFLLSIILLFNSCRKKNVFLHSEIYGHAGMGLNIISSIYAPNTLQSVRMACQFEKVTGVELDVRMSKDGVLWCYHDDYLEKATNGTGCIENLFSDNIEGIKYNSLHSETLFKLDASLLDQSKQYLLDLKIYNACEEETIDLVMLDSLLSQLAQTLQFDLILSNSAGLNFFSDRYPCYFSTTIDNITDAELQNNNIKGFVLRNKEVDRDKVLTLQGYGKKVILFDIRSNAGNRKALEKGPNAILSDDIRTAIGYVP